MQDLASVEEREAAAALAARLSPTAVLLPCERGQVPCVYVLLRVCSMYRCTHTACARHALHTLSLLIRCEPNSYLGAARPAARCARFLSGALPTAGPLLPGRRRAAAAPRHAPLLRHPAPQRRLLRRRRRRRRPRQRQRRRCWPRRHSRPRPRELWVSRAAPPSGFVRARRARLHGLDRAGCNPM